MKDKGIPKDILSKLQAIKRDSTQPSIRIAEIEHRIPQKRPHPFPTYVFEREDRSQSILDKLQSSLDLLRSSDEEVLEEALDTQGAIQDVPNLPEKVIDKISITSVLKMLRQMNKKLHFTAPQLKIIEKYNIKLDTNFWVKHAKNKAKKSFKKHKDKTKQLFKRPFNIAEIKKEIEGHENPYLNFRFRMIPFHGYNSIRLMSLQKLNNFL